MDSKGPSRRNLGTVVRAIANWVNLSTPLGLGIAALGGARISRGPQRLWLAEGYRLRLPRAGAFTVGSVVVVPHRNLADLTAHWPRLLDHEARHARQWALCLGLPMLPLYLLAMGWSWVRTGTAHSANAFEVDAGLEHGGYRAAPLRRWWHR